MNKRCSGAVEVDHRKLPVGTILSTPIKGDFLAMPLFGWVAKRAKVETPLVMVATLLFKSVEDPAPRATFQIEMPLLDETEKATLATLERFGWDGRVWPIDEGWPTGAEDEANLLILLERAKLKATLTFPPGDKGVATQNVSIQRAQGPFLMPPLPEPEGEVDPAKLERLRQLCANPLIFTNPMKPTLLH